MILIIRTLAIYHEQRRSTDSKFSSKIMFKEYWTLPYWFIYCINVILVPCVNHGSSQNYRHFWSQYIHRLYIRCSWYSMANLVLVQVERIPTFQLLARDSLIYFLLMFSLLLANLFIFRFGQGFLGALLLVPSTIVACISAGRMMMNLRSLSLAPGATEFLDMDTIDWQADTNTIGGLIPE
ncbi:hypothetical protein LENED_006562 [Lentinula edodes]|uniref:Uncharacterized protein n=1 Tax=Lentinula edodes TaxID=5353 RepID=A0A1Q3EC06_LENED|nr:hypothetical protein LENED_006562 [Lentinula edodes]